MSEGRSVFWKQVGFIFSGTAAAQAIPLLGSLLIARIYIPAEFGAFAAWLGIVSIAAVILTGRFESALPIVADGERRKVAALATLIVASASAVVCGLVLLVFSWILPSLFITYQFGLMAMLVPASFVLACTNIWQHWAAAEGKLPALAAIRIIQAFAITVLQILGGYFYPEAVILAGSILLGTAVATLYAALIMPLTPHSIGTNREWWQETKEFWVTYRRFPLLALPADGINMVAAQLPVFILASRFGTEVAGFFALTIRVLGAPISLLGIAVLDVFKRTAALSFRKHGHCREEYWTTFRVLAVGAALSTIILSYVSESGFVLIFGEQWREAGLFAVWLMPMFGLKFVASPLSYVFYIASKQHIDLYWQLGLLVVTIMTMCMPSQHIDAIQSYAVGYSTLYILYIWLSWHISKGAKK